MYVIRLFGFQLAVLHFVHQISLTLTTNKSHTKETRTNCYYLIQLDIEGR